MIFIIELLVIITTFIYQYRSKKDYKIPIYLAVSLMLIAGLRYNYKLDYNNYRTIFNEITVFSDVVHSIFEKGFVFLILLFKKLGLGFYTFMLAVAVVSVLLKYKFFNKFSAIPLVSLLIYFLIFFIFNDMEQIRHGLAIGIALSSVTFVMQDKFWKFLGIVFIASLIHYSAIVFLLLYFVRDIKFSKKSLLVCGLSVAIFSFIDIMNIAKYINNNFINNSYLDRKLALYSNQFIGLISVTLLIRLFVIAMCFIYLYNPENKQSRVMFNAYFIGVCIFCLFRSIPILGVRGSVYFRYFELLLIPEYIVYIRNMLPTKTKYLKGISQKTVHCVCVSLLFGYYIIKFVQTLSVSGYFSYFSI